MNFFSSFYYPSKEIVNYLFMFDYDLFKDLNKVELIDKLNESNKIKLNNLLINEDSFNNNLLKTLNDNLNSKKCKLNLEYGSIQNFNFEFPKSYLTSKTIIHLDGVNLIFKIKDIDSSEDNKYDKKEDNFADSTSKESLFKILGGSINLLAKLLSINLSNLNVLIINNKNQGVSFRLERVNLIDVLDLNKDIKKLFIHNKSLTFKGIYLRVFSNINSEQVIKTLIDNVDTHLKFSQSLTQKSLIRFKSFTNYEYLNHVISNIQSNNVVKYKYDVEEYSDESLSIYFYQEKLESDKFNNSKNSSNSSKIKVYINLISIESYLSKFELDILLDILDLFKSDDYNENRITDKIIDHDIKDNNVTSNLESKGYKFLGQIIDAVELNFNCLLYYTLFNINYFKEILYNKKWLDNDTSIKLQKNYIDSFDNKFTILDIKDKFSYSDIEKHFTNINSHSLLIYSNMIYFKSHIEVFNFKNNYITQNKILRKFSVTDIKLYFNAINICFLQYLQNQTNENKDKTYYTNKYSYIHNDNIYNEYSYNNAIDSTLITNNNPKIKCYNVIEVLSIMFNIKLNKIKDYITNETNNNEVNNNNDMLSKYLSKYKFYTGIDSIIINYNNLVISLLLPLFYKYYCLFIKFRNNNKESTQNLNNNFKTVNKGNTETNKINFVDLVFLIKKFDININSSIYLNESNKFYNDNHKNFLDLSYILNFKNYYLRNLELLEFDKNTKYYNSSIYSFKQDIYSCVLNAVSDKNCNCLNPSTLDLDINIKDLELFLIKINFEEILLATNKESFISLNSNKDFSNTSDLKHKEEVNKKQDNSNNIVHNQEIICNFGLTRSKIEYFSKISNQILFHFENSNYLNTNFNSIESTFDIIYYKLSNINYEISNIDIYNLLKANNNYYIFTAILSTKINPYNIFEDLNENISDDSVNINVEKYSDNEIKSKNTKLERENQNYHCIKIHIQNTFIINILDNISNNENKSNIANNSYCNTLNLNLLGINLLDFYKKLFKLETNKIQFITEVKHYLINNIDISNDIRHNYLINNIKEKTKLSNTFKKRESKKKLINKKSKLVLFNFIINSLNVNYLCNDISKYESFNLKIKNISVNFINSDNNTMLRLAIANILGILKYDIGNNLSIIKIPFFKPDINLENIISDKHFIDNAKNLIDIKLIHTTNNKINLEKYLSYIINNDNLNINTAFKDTLEFKRNTNNIILLLDISKICFNRYINDLLLIFNKCINKYEFNKTSLIFTKINNINCNFNTENLNLFNSNCIDITQFQNKNNPNIRYKVKIKLKINEVILDLYTYTNNKIEYNILNNIIVDKHSFNSPQCSELLMNNSNYLFAKLSNNEIRSIILIKDISIKFKLHNSEHQKSFNINLNILTLNIVSLKNLNFCYACNHIYNYYKSFSSFKINSSYKESELIRLGYVKFLTIQDIKFNFVSYCNDIEAEFIINNIYIGATRDLLLSIFNNIDNYKNYILSLRNQVCKYDDEYYYYNKCINKEDKTFKNILKFKNKINKIDILQIDKSTTLLDYIIVINNKYNDIKNIDNSPTNKVCNKKILDNKNANKVNICISMIFDVIEFEIYKGFDFAFISSKKLNDKDTQYTKEELLLKENNVRIRIDDSVYSKRDEKNSIKLKIINVAFELKSYLDDISVEFTDKNLFGISFIVLSVYNIIIFDNVKNSSIKTIFSKTDFDKNHINLINLQIIKSNISLPNSELKLLVYTIPNSNINITSILTLSDISINVDLCSIMFLIEFFKLDIQNIINENLDKNNNTNIVSYGNNYNQIQIPNMYKYDKLNISNLINIIQNNIVIKKLIIENFVIKFSFYSNKFVRKTVNIKNHKFNTSNTIDLRDVVIIIDKFKIKKCKIRQAYTKYIHLIKGILEKNLLDSTIKSIYIVSSIRTILKSISNLIISPYNVYKNNCNNFNEVNINEFINKNFNNNECKHNKYTYDSPLEDLSEAVRGVFTTTVKEITYLIDYSKKRDLTEISNSLDSKISKKYKYFYKS